MTRKTPRILVLEDSRTQARLIARLFETEGFGTEILTSADELEARDWQADLPFDAAIVDVHFGDTSGITLLSRIREYWPAIPTIMMTANKTNDYCVLADAREHGADIVLRKPFSKTDISNVLADLDSIAETGGRRRHVVVIDDSAAARRIAVSVLTAFGFRVSSFPSGLDAIQQLSFDFVDVVLTDLNMPGMSGDELIHLVRDVWGEVGIVAMSSDLKLCRNRAMIDAFVPKPYDGSELHRAIRQAMPPLPERRFSPAVTFEADIPDLNVFELDC